MTVTQTAYPDRETWLKNRHGIGASEAGSVCGVGFKSPTDLWREKVTGETGPDISDNPRVKFGNDAEPYMRDMFGLLHPEYKLWFKPYTIFRRDDKYDFMFYTPDGILTRKSDGAKGVYECKTATLQSGTDYERWKDKIPPGYYCQLLHGMFVADLQFAVLFAMLLNRDGDANIRAYTIQREDCEADIQWLVDKEVEFWKCVENKTQPGTTLFL